MDYGKHFEIRKGRYCCSLEVAAAICGVTIQSYANWRKDENPPPFDKNTRSVDLAALGEWIRAEQVLKRGRGGAGFPYLPKIDQIYKGSKMPGIPENETSEARLKRLQADKLQIEIDVSTGKLIPVEKVQDTWSLIATRVKTRLLRIPVALAPLVTGLSDEYAVQEKLSDGVNEALEALADADLDRVD